jgi:hypothetical protein
MTFKRLEQERSSYLHIKLDVDILWGNTSSVDIISLYNVKENMAFERNMPLVSGLMSITEEPEEWYVRNDAWEQFVI